MSEYVGGYTHQKYPADIGKVAVKTKRFKTPRNFPWLLGVCGCRGNAVRHQSACLRIKIAEVILKILLKHQILNFCKVSRPNSQKALGFQLCAVCYRTTYFQITPEKQRTDQKT